MNLRPHPSARSQRNNLKASKGHLRMKTIIELKNSDITIIFKEKKHNGSLIIGNSNPNRLEQIRIIDEKTKEENRTEQNRTLDQISINRID